jgi:hypothetical protein
MLERNNALVVVFGISQPLRKVAGDPGGLEVVDRRVDLPCFLQFYKMNYK